MPNPFVDIMDAASKSIASNLIGGRRRMAEILQERLFQERMQQERFAQEDKAAQQRYSQEDKNAANVAARETARQREIDTRASDRLTQQQQHERDTAARLTATDIQKRYEEGKIIGNEPGITLGGATAPSPDIFAPAFNRTAPTEVDPNNPNQTYHSLTPAEQLANKQAGVRDAVRKFAADPMNASYLKDNPDFQSEMLAHELFQVPYTQERVDSLVAQDYAVLQDKTASAADKAAAKQRIELIHRPPAAAGAGIAGGLTGDSLVNMARMYNNGVPLGQVAPGMGNASAAMRIAVVNKATELAKLEGAPGMTAGRLASLKADTKSLLDLQGRSDQLEAFENTAKKNLQLMYDQMQKLVDTGSPLLNLPIREAQKKASGNVEVAGFNAAQRVALNEVAKITSNPNMTGVLTDEARNEASKLVPEGATLPQAKRVLDLLYRDMDNRVLSNHQQLQTIHNRIDNPMSTYDDLGKPMPIPQSTPITAPNPATSPTPAAPTKPPSLFGSDATIVRPAGQ